MPARHRQPDLAQRLAVQGGQVAHPAAPTRPSRSAAGRRRRPRRTCRRVRPSARSVSASRRVPGSSAQVTTNPSGSVSRANSANAGLQAGQVAVGVEVVRLDVRDDRDVRAVDAGTTGRSRPPRPRSSSPLPWCAVRADLGDLAADHERRVRARPAAASASPSRWWWSCRACRPPRWCGGRSSPRPAPRSGAAPAGRGGGPRPAPGGPAGSPRSRPRCPRRPGWPPRGVMWMVPPSARSPASDGHSRSSLPETGMPRVSSSRASPLMPTPPIPIRCTAPRSSAVERAGRGELRDVHRATFRLRCRSSAHRLVDEVQQRLVTVAPAVPRPRRRPSRPAAAGRGSAG